MKLSIDLADREEIAAAVPLLQLILDNTPKTCGGECHAQDPATVFGGGAAVPAPLAVSIPPAPLPSTDAPASEATTAPTTTTLGPVSSGAGVASVELDKRGLPWDERIHSSSKAKLANGNWKNARGKDPEYVTQIEAELQGRAASAGSDVVIPPTPVIPAPPPVDAPAAPAWPFPPAEVPAAPANADPTTFEQLMPRITAAVTAGIMPPTAVGAACAAHGAASVVTLQQQPAFVPLVWATLKQQYPALV